MAQFLCRTLLSPPEHIRQTEPGAADSSTKNQASGQHGVALRKAREHTGLRPLRCNRSTYDVRLTVALVEDIRFAQVRVTQDPGCLILV